MVHNIEFYAYLPNIIFFFISNLGRIRIRHFFQAVPDPRKKIRILSEKPLKEYFVVIKSRSTNMKKEDPNHPSHCWVSH